MPQPPWVVLDNELEEELTALGPVDFLPIPDFSTMQNQWEQIRASFKNSQRYRAGKLLDSDWLSAQIFDRILDDKIRITGVRYTLKLMLYLIVEKKKGVRPEWHLH